MKPEDILKKAIEKAVKNGYKFRYDLDDEDGKKAFEVTVENWCNICDQSMNAVLFDHQFAKAFWGDEEILNEDCVDVSDLKGGWETGEWFNRLDDSINLDGWFSYVELPQWQYHLMKLAISEDRLQYISKFL